MAVAREYIFNSTLAAMIFTAYAALRAVGEARFDVYLSIYTLVYIALTGIIRPRRISRDYLEAALLALFIYFVSLRILEVLYKP